MSMQRAMLEGRDIQRFCTALAQNKFLKVLRLGQNRLGDEGIDYLGEAISINTTLEHLDLFGAEFANLGARFLEHALRKSRISLKSLRLANTRVTVEQAELLLDAVNSHVAL